MIDCNLYNLRFYFELETSANAFMFYLNNDRLNSNKNIQKSISANPAINYTSVNIANNRPVVGELGLLK